MKKDTYKILRMDCPAEEQLVRMKLEMDASIKKLEFDLPNRILTVYHEGETATITGNIAQINLNSSLIQSEEVFDLLEDGEQTSNKKLLWIVFAINSGFFLIEIVAGLLSRSMGLIADSLDMLADAIVYGMSLTVVTSTTVKKKRIARLSGIFQLCLAIFGLVEVVRRFLGVEGTPDYQTMILVSSFALAGNAASLYLLRKSKSNEAHMQASYIFTSNDVMANIGVMIAGLLVYFTQSMIPDLAIGTIVFLLVSKGAFRILAISR
ncbi:MAG: cation transporter [Bacteroidetes bacterium]|nr:MAG: cation transporter [Bacteroidota bacterium]